MAEDEPAGPACGAQGRVAGAPELPERLLGGLPDHLGRGVQAPGEGGLHHKGQDQGLRAGSAPLSLAVQVSPALVLAQPLLPGLMAERIPRPGRAGPLLPTQRRQGGPLCLRCPQGRLRRARALPSGHQGRRLGSCRCRSGRGSWLPRLSCLGGCSREQPHALQF